MVQTFESGYASTLSQKFSSTDTTMYVATPPTVTSWRIYLTDGSQKEWVQFTGVSGSTLTWCVRGLSKTADPSTAGVGLNRLAGNPVVLVAMHDQLRDKNQATEALIYGKTYATEAARDAALGANGVAIHPYTNVYVTATGLHYNYNLATWLRESIDTWTTTPNASEGAAGKVELATPAEILARTLTGGTWAATVITTDKVNTIPMTAWENLTAGTLVRHKWLKMVYNTTVWFKAAETTTNGTWLATSTTVRMLKTIAGDWNWYWHVINVYKKAADNKIYATASSYDLWTKVLTVWAEVKVSDTALSANETFAVTDLYNSANYNKFVVVFKSNADSKPYAVVCNLSTVTITAWSTTKISDLTVEADTILSVANSWAIAFTVARHDATSDDPYINPCTYSNTTITPWSDLSVEAVTMNAAWWIILVQMEPNTGSDVLWIFYDNWTNIRFVTITGDWTVVKTPNSLATWHITNSMQAISQWIGKALLFQPAAWRMTVSQVIWDPLTGYANSYYNAKADIMIEFDNWVLSWYNVILIPDTTTEVRNRWFAMVNYTAALKTPWPSSATTYRYREFEVYSNSVKTTYDFWCMTTDADSWAVALCNLHQTAYSAKMISFRNASTWVLFNSLFMNTSPICIGTAQETKNTWETVNVSVPSLSTIISSSDTSRVVYVWNSWAIASRGSRKIWTKVAANTMILQS